MKEKNLFPPNNQLANFTRYCVLTLICRFLNARYTLKQHYVCFIQQTCKVTLHSSLLGNYFQNDFNFRNNIVTVFSHANAKAIRVFALKANLTSGAKQYLASWICPCGPNFPSAILRIKKIPHSYSTTLYKKWHLFEIICVFLRSPLLITTVSQFLVKSLSRTL